MGRKPPYPFVPRSTAYMEPGQFWGVRLLDGRWAAGRMLQFMTKEDGQTDSRLFLAGILGWIGHDEPSSSDIAGAPLLECGTVHIRTIEWNGGRILGHRPLEADGIVIPTFVDASGIATVVMRGTVPIRRAIRGDELRYPCLTTWGLSVIRIAAEKHLSR